MKLQPKLSTSKFFFLSFLIGALCLVQAGPPFPEVWNPNPLKYPYVANESLYLTSTQRHAKSEASLLTSLSKKIAEVFTRTFPLPPSGRGPIRVLLQEGDEKLMLSAPSGADLQGFRSAGNMSRERFFPGTIQIELKRGEFRVSGSKGRAFSGKAIGLRFVTQDSAAPLKLDGKTYRGTLEFYPDDGSIQSVNVLPLEDYLRGVVPLEMGHRSEQELEALKAQAVAARTYALKFMLTHDSSNFDIRGSIEDQVYGGVGAEYALSDQAIRETKGRVLLYADTLAMCYYHSTCGGMTASRNEVWGGAVIPYLVTTSDRDPSGKPWCQASHYMQWSESWSLAELTDILRNNLENAGVRAPAFRRLKDFRVKSRFADGRINVLEVKTDRGAFELHGDKIRVALKTAKGRMLESARFDIVVQGDRVIARGNGYGHGVGMCQMGALGRAVAGQSFREILAAYYPGTVLALAK